MSKTRLDKLLLERGLAGSRERAQALVLAGRVLVNEQKIDKPGAAVSVDAVVRMLGGDLRYVSRGGLKLETTLARRPRRNIRARDETALLAIATSRAPTWRTPLRPRRCR